MAAGRADLDYASAADSELGRSCSSAGRISQLTEEEGERVLEEGTGPQGDVLQPPMHIYHMKHEDAKAIIAYLSSLPRAAHNQSSD